MTILNGLSLVVLVVNGVVILAGLGMLAGSLIEDDEEGLKNGAATFFVGLIAAVVFFAGSFFPAW